MDLHLNGHTALITGAASGIGLATARAFAAEGCSLALWDKSSTIESVARQMAEQWKVVATGSQTEITNWEEVKKTFAQTLVEHASIDHVIHCAAVGSGKFGFPFTNLQPADWHATIDVNIQGMVHLAHATAQYFIQQKAGTYVFLASVAGQVGSQTDPPYSASKAANINFAQCMAKDLAPHGVRVNTVCPGMVQTSLNRSVWQAWHDQVPVADRLSYDEWAGKKIQAMVPLGSWQTPDDIASMIVFLSSIRAAQVTGQTINVDGGFVMHW